MKINEVLSGVVKGGVALFLAALAKDSADAIKRNKETKAAREMAAAKERDRREREEKEKNKSNG